MNSRHVKHQARLNRQFDALQRRNPATGPILSAMRDNRFRLIRIPFAILLVLGSFLAILPVFGLWMMPLGLLLLAVDLPVLRPRVNAALIRLRRWWTRRRRR
jgi:hypothetical protein